MQPAFIAGLAKMAIAALGRTGTAPQGASCPSGLGGCALNHSLKEAA